jgi:hypothetical protein
MTTQSLDQFVARAAAYVPPEPWDALQPSGSVLVMPSLDGWDGTVARPVTAAPSRESSVPQTGEAPFRVTPGKPFLPLRRRDGRTFDVVNTNGCLVSSDPPVFVCLGDSSTGDMALQMKRVLVAVDADDVGVLRLLGTPVAPAGRLASLSAHELRRLHGPVGLNETVMDGEPFPDLPSGAYAPVAVHDLAVTIVDWSITKLSLDRPAGVDEIISRMQLATDAMGLFGFTRLQLWKPKPHLFRSIAAAAHLKDYVAVQHHLWHSIRRDEHSIAAPVGRPTERPPQSLAEANAQLRSLLASGSGTNREALRRAITALESHYYGPIVDGLLQDMLHTPDLLDRGFMFAAAEVLERLFRNSESLQTAKNRAANNFALQPDLAESSASEQSRAIDDLVKISKALHRE